MGKNYIKAMNGEHNNGEPSSGQSFDIEVTRFGIGQRTISVRAETLEEAESFALRDAGNYEYSEHSSEYVITDGANSDEAYQRQTELVNKVITLLKKDMKKGRVEPVGEMLRSLLNGIPWNADIINSYLHNEE